MRLMIQLFVLIGFSFINVQCALFSSKDKEEPTSKQDYPKYENYHSSGVYKDIEDASRSISSEEYADDEYGDLSVDEADKNDQDEDVLLSSDDESPTDPMEDSGTDPLPVEKLKPVKKKAEKKVAKLPKFKNGMYRMGVDCNMRQKPTAKSQKVGTVKKGKKLWVEAHNNNWVKVYKKSGAVYINRGCL